MLHAMRFDPDAAAPPDSGIFGLPTPPEEARFVVVPVPFDATTSYRDGTRHGPAAVAEASRQVDLFDLDFGRPYEAGIAMLPARDSAVRMVSRLNREARKLAEPVIRVGGDVRGNRKLEQALARVNEISEEVNGIVEATVSALLQDGRMPVVLGGDHSTPFGSIKAHAKRHPGLGVLHVDAHADLREAYEGFEWSHASIMNNVVRRIGAAGGVAQLVQVGIRDFGEAEFEEIRRKRTKGETKITTYFDADLHRLKFNGEDWAELCDEVVANLPSKVYVSVDIDGLEPSLCPDTGTPVPGGLSFNEFLELLRALVRSKKTIVGFDLNEVAPNRATPKEDWGGDWNANVGARVLYKLIGAAARR